MFIFLSAFFRKRKLLPGISLRDCHWNKLNMAKSSHAHTTIIFMHLWVTYCISGKSQNLNSNSVPYLRIINSCRSYQRAQKNTRIATCTLILFDLFIVSRAYCIFFLTQNSSSFAFLMWQTSLFIVLKNIKKDEFCVTVMLI